MLEPDAIRKIAEDIINAKPSASKGRSVTRPKLTDLIAASRILDNMPQSTNTHTSSNSPYTQQKIDGGLALNPYQSIWNDVIDEDTRRACCEILFTNLEYLIDILENAEISQEEIPEIIKNWLLKAELAVKSIAMNMDLNEDNAHRLFSMVHRLGKVDINLAFPVVSALVASLPIEYTDAMIRIGDKTFDKNLLSLQSQDKLKVLARINAFSETSDGVSSSASKLLLVLLEEDFPGIDSFITKLGEAEKIGFKPQTQKRGKNRPDSGQTAVKTTLVR